MRMPTDTKERMNSAFQLLTGAEISISSFENARALIKGIHPGIDKKLEACSKALDTFQKIENIDVISLSAEHLPEKDEKQKKRKKALLFFIENIKDLKSEIKRVQTELQNTQNNSSSSQLTTAGRIIKFAKGPLGLVTLAALIVVIAMPLVTHKTGLAQQAKPTITPTMNKSTIQVITYQGKQIPLSQLRIGQPHYPGCGGQHYHALNTTTEAVTTLDGAVMYDPGGCGFGKVADMQVTNVESSK